MNKICISQEIKNGNKLQIVGDKFYKFNPDTDIIPVIDRINANRALFDKDILVVIEAYLYYKECFYGISMEYLEGYKTIRRCIAEGIKFDAYNIINVVVDNILRMESIDILYYDLHLSNIMIKDGKYPKITDLDEAIIKTKYDDYLLSRERMLDFIFQIYLDYCVYDASSKKMVDVMYPLCDIKEIISLREYFSKEVIDYCDAVLKHDEVVNDIDFYPILKQVNDPDKMEDIRKKILLV